MVGRRLAERPGGSSNRRFGRPSSSDRVKVRGDELWLVHRLPAAVEMADPPEDDIDFEMNEDEAQHGYKMHVTGTIAAASS